VQPQRAPEQLTLVERRALRAFRQRFVPWRECSWTQVLRLYLAAYCVETRELWAFVLAQPPTIQRAPNELAHDVAVIRQQLPLIQTLRITLIF
jgi:hypothetical protein